MNTLKTIIGSTVVISIACGLLPYFILRGSDTSISMPVPALWLVILPVGIFGLSMIIWVAVNFVRVGKGTPVPIDPPKHLVARGLFRYLRNPMYAGAILVLLAEVLFFSSSRLLLYTFILWLCLHAFVVLIEEPQLKRRFGVEYEQYLTNVPRWFPRLGKPPPP